MNAIIVLFTVLAVVSNSYGAPTSGTDVTIQKWKAEIDRMLNAKLNQGLHSTQNVDWAAVQELVDVIKIAIPKPYKQIATIAKVGNQEIGGIVETKLSAYYAENIEPLLLQLDEQARKQTLTVDLVDDIFVTFLAIGQAPDIFRDEYEQLSVLTQGAIDVRAYLALDEVFMRGVQLFNLLW